MGHIGKLPPAHLSSNRPHQTTQRKCLRRNENAKPASHHPTRRQTTLTVRTETEKRPARNGRPSTAGRHSRLAGHDLTLRSLRCAGYRSGRHRRSDTCSTDLVVVEDLIRVLQYRVDDLDLPAGVGDGRTGIGAHECGSEYHGQIVRVHAVDV